MPQATLAFPPLPVQGPASSVHSGLTGKPGTELVCLSLEVALRSFAKRRAPIVSRTGSQVLCDRGLPLPWD